MESKRIRHFVDRVSCFFSFKMGSNKFFMKCGMGYLLCVNSFDIAIHSHPVVVMEHALIFPGSI